VAVADGLTIISGRNEIRLNSNLVHTPNQEFEEIASSLEIKRLHIKNAAKGKEGVIKV